MTAAGQRPRQPPLRVAVLASGRGSNLQALIAAQRDDGLPIRIVLVAGDKAQAPALRHAEDAGIASLALNPKSFARRAEFDAELFRRVAEAEPELVVLAGYMRIIDAAVVDAWHGRIINIHPSLLPKYPGLDTHSRALAAGDREHGSSVHFVTAELDGGPVIAQVKIGITSDDTPESLATRLLPFEHRLLSACVGLFAARRIALGERGMLLDGAPLAAPLQLVGARLAPA